MKRAYTRNQIYEIQFPITDYDFPTERGMFTGTLMMKKWIDNGGLLCYFDSDCGEKYKICVWFKHDENRTYRPKNSDIDISELAIGTRLEVTHGVTRTGKTRWDDVKII